MNREIKFRAWDNENKRFVYFDLINDGIKKLFSLTEWINAPKQQYTGLKDKNAKEIYEGDIVKMNYHEDHKDVFIVEWQEDRWWAGNFSHFDWDLKDKCEWESCEIIGNIYETTN